MRDHQTAALRRARRAHQVDLANFAQHVLVTLAMFPGNGLAGMEVRRAAVKYGLGTVSENGTFTATPRPTKESLR